MPKGPMTRQRTRTPDPPPAELGLIVSPSSSHVMPQPPTGTQTDACDGDEGAPEEFRIYADEELEEKIKRSSRKQTFALPDGGEKMRKFVYRMRKELDRRRAARPRKVDTGHEQAVQIISGDDPCTLMPPPMENTSNHAPDKLQESVCQVEKELDHRLTAGPGKVDTGDGQAVKIVGGNDSHTLMPPPVDNASNHARVINSEPTDGGLNPLASPNLEGQAVTSTNVGAEEVQPTAYTCPRQKGEDTGNKGQLSQMAMLLEVENFLELNMKQIQKLVEEVKEAPKQEDRFTIEKCVAALEAIEELTDVEKAKALRLFKCSLNREIFMSTKSATVRLIWLKREIDA
ncbi:uncharacterized protein LOC123440233 [Hordeum vulgare subsp. vulgare]|uniref:uncharacterized protein LOC123440233 n=1 Tax=Hordeum vulgare subsp. vulgare TaxID=112509 RepID=UPI001D1A50F6|nr:uncharacterized protein LOC123440233 [Hordeum vulgare subsp. vulgare]